MLTCQPVQNIAWNLFNLLKTPTRNGFQIMSLAIYLFRMPLICCISQLCIVHPKFLMESIATEVPLSMMASPQRRWCKISLTFIMEACQILRAWRCWLGRLSALLSTQDWKRISQSLPNKKRGGYKVQTLIYHWQQWHVASCHFSAVKHWSIHPSIIYHC